ncbi:MAG TPA: hypothetical protein VGZ52_04010 [Acidimicrobiales bacterium]|jgi:hypothetical protein|nr:hypothetical protein [Acidimicrobiales bacterium]
MSEHLALAAAATLLALAFGFCTLERWLDKRKAHEAAWTAALFLFAAASASLWAGAAFGWNALWFRLFYLFGAIVNVPYLALGTVYLLADRRKARRIAVGVHAFAAFSAGVVVVAPLRGSIAAGTLPQGSDVFGALPRVLAATGSGVAAVVIVAGAVWSAARLVRRRSTRRVALANGLIATGTVILGAGGILNSVLNEMDGFAVSLVAGITVIFAGFLLTNAPRRRVMQVVAAA